MSMLKAITTLQKKTKIRKLIIMLQFKDFQLLISLSSLARIIKNIKHRFLMKSTKTLKRNNKLNSNQICAKTWINKIKNNQIKFKRRLMKLIKDLIF